MLDSKEEDVTFQIVGPKAPRCPDEAVSEAALTCTEASIPAQRGPVGSVRAPEKRWTGLRPGL
ncbi:hypothetical protein GCM10010271_39210 [Streptomyces kurssanovii]|nr:hypothetical protein GCM10010271_39210 [Streptomyces kurssanovii]